jgi:hypothetical protein
MAAVFRGAVNPDISGRRAVRVIAATSCSFAYDGGATEDVWPRRSRMPRRSISPSDRAPERLRVFRSCPLITPQGARSSLPMLAIARAMAALGASIGHLLPRCSVTPERLSASEMRFLRQRLHDIFHSPSQYSGAPASNRASYGAVTAIMRARVTRLRQLRCSQPCPNEGLAVAPRAFATGPSGP